MITRTIGQHVTVTEEEVTQQFEALQTDLAYRDARTPVRLSESNSFYIYDADGLFVCNATSAHVARQIVAAINAVRS